jgi:uncharacterized Tic20 family protein
MDAPGLAGRPLEVKMTAETMNVLPVSQPAPLTESEEHTWAMLAHLSVLVNLFTGFLGPVVALTIYLIFANRSKYVAYHAMQSFISNWSSGVDLA